MKNITAMCDQYGVPLPITLLELLNSDDPNCWGCGLFTKRLEEHQF